MCSYIETATPRSGESTFENINRSRLTAATPKLSRFGCQNFELRLEI